MESHFIGTKLLFHKAQYFSDELFYVYCAPHGGTLEGHSGFWFCNDLLEVILYACHNGPISCLAILLGFIACYFPSVWEQYGLCQDRQHNHLATYSHTLLHVYTDVPDYVT